MPISVRGTPTSAFNDTGAGTCTITKPTGTTTNDLIVIIASMDSDGTEANMTAPTGFALLGTAGAESGTSPSIKFWQKASNGAEASTFAVPGDPAAAMNAFCISLIGANTTTPLRAGPTYGVGTSTAMTAPDVGSGSALVGDLELVVYECFGTGTFTFTTPTGMTKLADINSAWIDGSADYIICTSAGAQGTRACTRGGPAISGNYRSGAVIIAQAPASTNRGLLLPV